MRFRIFSEIFDCNPWFQSLHSILASYGQEFAPATASYGLAGPDPGMAGEQIEASTSTCTVATTRSAIVRYRTVPGEVYEASKDLLYGKSTATVRYSYCRSRGE